MKFAPLAALLLTLNLCVGSARAVAAEVVDDSLPPPSSAAQKLYAAAKADLLQIRILVKSGRSQASVGSGFLVGTSRLVVTNYHVVSQLAISPETYVGEFSDTDGRSGPVELLAVDVLHDLAVVRITRAGSGFFNLPETSARLGQGQYLYSLGNPLDLGFAISEGAYNGVIKRSFYDQLLFTGPINAGMSGGPNVTADGTVVGVNVAKRRDGELVSFLVPARHAQELLRQVEQQKAPPADFKTVIGQQLLAHQQNLVSRLLDSPFSLKALGPYMVPVRESDQIRCWGYPNARTEGSFSDDGMACNMESAIYIAENQQTGHVNIHHRYLRAKTLDTLRFAALASSQFRERNLGGGRDTRLTAPRCTESFVRNGALPVRAVLCMRAYRKFAGLYDFTLLTATVDDPRASLQSRLDVNGVSFDNGMRVTRSFLSALSKGGQP
ncbi:serine protease [Massilia sp. TS11]|uniref:S1 family peptidase n=1 Tax=Massilia sp. TS11 TaxID=2908003 RepID=UPI001EDC207F|nr:serine protease [Massilia sp. TS11]MCG2583261.1 serine protease [Massilia sp. TS11]